MSELGIFLIGAAVTLLVAGALVLVLLGAVADGRVERDVRTRERARAADGAPLPVAAGGERLPVA